MNIIVATGATPPYIAGIFEQSEQAIAYMSVKPETLVGVRHENSIEYYPFYIVQINSEFIPFQTLIGAKMFCEPHGQYILYTITEDFVPNIVWNDEMGSLHHVHIDSENC